MKKISEKEMAETQGGFWWAVFILGAVIGYLVGAGAVGDNITGSGGPI